MARPRINFSHYMDGKLHVCTPKAIGLKPKQFQRLLYRKAAFMREKFEMLIRVRSVIEGENILFRVIVDGD